MWKSQILKELEEEKRNNEKLKNEELFNERLKFRKYIENKCKENGLKVSNFNNVKTKEGAYNTNVDRVFTAGDMHRGQSLVVWAIREGREVAKVVDESMMGYTNL